MDKKILVIGELNVDVIVSGLPALPALGQEILASGLHIVMGSSSAICAAGMTRLGATVDLIGMVGADDYGAFVVEQLRQLGIGTQHIIRDPTMRTGVTISLTYPDDRALITYLGCIPHLHPKDIRTATLRRYDHLHVSSYFLQRGLQAGLPELFRQARDAQLTISLDTGHDPDEKWGAGELQTLLELVDIFMPNEEEARCIAGIDNTETALRELAQHARLVVVKCGPSGAMTLHDERIIHSPAFRVNVVDTTGAGDSFDAGLVYARVIQGLPLEEALRLANACGALSTTGLGGTAAQPTLDQALSFLESQTQWAPWHPN